ncbi:MAG: cell division protein FtsA [Ktedonobacterales bacterium]
MGAPPMQLYAGLDIGATKIALLVVARDLDGSLRYIEGTRVAASGMRDGAVVDLGEVADAIERAIYEVEERLDRRLPALCVGAGGRHIHSINLRGAANITPVGREISHDDVAHALGMARAGLRLGESRELLHEIPRAYMVDGQVGVRDPRGMAGGELEVEVHYVSAAAAPLKNLLKCVRQASGVPEMVVAAPLAAAEAVRESYPGAQSLAIADIGAESTHLTLLVAGTVWLSEVIAEGGSAITRELAAQFKLPYPSAEELKVAHGHCDPAHFDEFALVEQPDQNGFADVLPVAEVARVIQRRAYGFTDLLAEHFENARSLGVEPEALVLTGGGAELAGLRALLARGLDLPVYRGRVAGIAGMPPVLETPAFATVAGLALWHARYGGGGDAASQHRRALPGLLTGVRRLLGVATKT